MSEILPKGTVVVCSVCAMRDGYRYLSRIIKGLIDVYEYTFAKYLRTRTVNKAHLHIQLGFFLFYLFIYFFKRLC